MEDGGVLVGMLRYVEGESKVITYVMTPVQWAEAVASVTPVGATPATIAAAKRLHGFEL